MWLAGISLALALWDAYLLIGLPDQWYLGTESAARLIMAAFAFLLARAAWRQARARLLVGILLGLSLDLYWQTPSAYQPQWVLWAAMVVKYVSVPLGLMAVLRFATHLGGPPTRIGTRLYDAAPWFALALCVAGITLGSLCITSGLAGGGPVVVGLFTPRHTAYIVYLLAAIAARVAIIVAVADAVAAGRENRRRVLMVASSVVFFSLGTIVNFGVRLLPGQDWSNSWGDILDALATLLLILGLSLAGKKRMLPGIEMPAIVDRALLQAFSGLLFFCTFATAEWAANTAIMEGVIARSPLANQKSAQTILSLVVAMAVSAARKPVEEWVKTMLPGEHQPELSGHELRTKGHAE
jgi:hypothetical protein